MKLHKTNEDPMRLVLEAGRRMHLTVYSPEKPQTPPAFCMTLRKYLSGSWLSKVEQQDFERIVKFIIRTREGELQLILELFGEGNFVLINEKGEILQALFFKRMRDRNILRKEPYRFPPSTSKNPFKVGKPELEATLKASGETEIVRAIARFLGLGGLYAEELLLRADVDKAKACSMLEDSEVESIFNALQDMLSAVSASPLEPGIVLGSEGEFLDVVPFKLKRYERFKFQTYPSFNEALDEFYVRVTAAEKAVAGVEVAPMMREAERVKRTAEELEKALAEDEAAAESQKQIGIAIYANSVELQTLLDKFNRAKDEGKNWKSAIEEASMASLIFDSFDARNLAVNVKTDGLRFSLSLHRSIYENAAEYYDRSKKAKLKSAGARAALQETLRKLSEIEAKIAEAELEKSVKPAEALEELEKRRVPSKEWFEKFRWFLSTEGFLVVAGKDAVSNEVLIKKYTSPQDIVFHAEIVGSPFVTVTTDGKQPAENTLQEAGEFAAAFSRAWREGLGAADVYWIKPDQLSKSGPSGEFVPHGAFMVLGKRNWMRGVPLKLAIGLTTKDNRVKFIGGPIETVKSKASAYVVIVPGDSTGKAFLQQILRTIRYKSPKELREQINKANIESIREFVPFAKGRILESHP